MVIPPTRSEYSKDEDKTVVDESDQLGPYGPQRPPHGEYYIDDSAQEFQDHVVVTYTANGHPIREHISTSRYVSYEELDG